MNFVLNKDYMVVKVDDMATQTESGIYMPNAYFKGYVVFSGKGNYNYQGDVIPNPFKAGDTIFGSKAILRNENQMFPDYFMEREMQEEYGLLGDAKFYLISSTDVIGKWEKE